MTLTATEPNRQLTAKKNEPSSLLLFYSYSLRLFDHWPFTSGSVHPATALHDKCMIRVADFHHCLVTAFFYGCSNSQTCLLVTHRYTLCVAINSICVPVAKCFVFYECTALSKYEWNDWYGHSRLFIPFSALPHQPLSSHTMVPLGYVLRVFPTFELFMDIFGLTDRCLCCRLEGHTAVSGSIVSLDLLSKITSS